MKRTNTQFERHVDIDRRIRAGEFPSVPELAADWEVDERTIKRDVEFMRDRLLAPIEYDRKRRGYYYTEPIWGMPAVSMREGELVALLLARQALEQYGDLPLGTLLNHFYEQVLGFVGRHVGVDPERILAGFSFLSPPSMPVDADIWDRLSQCVMKRHTVELDYQSMSADGAQTYTVDPLHIANIEGEWYLFARSHYKGDILQLAISRIGKVEDSGEGFQASEVFGPDELKKLLFGRYASMQGEMEKVCVWVDAEYAPQVRIKQWHADQKVIENQAGDVEISFPVASGGSKQPYANVIGWVLGMGHHAKVLAPDRLKQLVADEIRQMAAHCQEA